MKYLIEGPDAARAARTASRRATSHKMQVGQVVLHRLVRRRRQAARRRHGHAPRRAELPPDRRRADCCAGCTMNAVGMDVDDHRSAPTRWRRSACRDRSRARC
ncbi:MAG: hypothetical protein MZV64_59115 [Ignavibacteriales bacterium]|nr:hypothetical protein [Ignavibacteriales bacterium]